MATQCLLRTVLLLALSCAKSAREARPAGERRRTAEEFSLTRADDNNPVVADLLAGSDSDAPADDDSANETNSGSNMVSERGVTAPVARPVASTSSVARETPFLPAASVHVL